MGRKNAGAGTPATVALTAAGVPFTAHAFAAQDRSRQPQDRSQQPQERSGRPRGPSTPFGVEAAEALGVEPERVFKTLVAEVDGQLWVAVVAVADQLDLKALAAAAGGKRAALADPAAAERSSGYVLGGISPLGQRRALPTVVDESALDHGTVFVSGGRRGLDLELAGADLVRLTAARTAPIARPR